MDRPSRIDFTSQLNLRSTVSASDKPATTDKMPVNYHERRQWQNKQRERGEAVRCGREACGCLIRGEAYVNQGTPLLYCKGCADRINAFNPGMCSLEPKQ